MRVLVAPVIVIVALKVPPCNASSEANDTETVGGDTGLATTVTLPNLDTVPPALAPPTTTENEVPIGVELEVLAVQVLPLRVNVTLGITLAVKDVILTKFEAVNVKEPPGNMVDVEMLKEKLGRL